MPSGDPFLIRDPPRLVAYTVGHPLYLHRFILRTVILVALVDVGPLVDALLSCFFPSGCYAIMVVLFSGCFTTGVFFELGGCFTAIPLLWWMLCRCGYAFWWMLRHCFMTALLWLLWRQYILFVQV